MEAAITVHIHIEQTTRRLVGFSIAFGFMSLILSAHHFFLLATSIPFDTVYSVLSLGAFFLILVFGIFLPIRINEKLSEGFQKGRFYLRCAVGLYIAFVLVLIAVFGPRILFPPVETIFVFVFMILTFITPSLHLSIGYRYHRLAHLTQEHDVLIISEEGQILSIGGIAILCIISALILGFLARTLAVWWVEFLALASLALVAISLCLAFIAILMYAYYTR